MNERFREFAKEAGFRADVTISDANSNHIVTTTEERLEKFAELILRECLEQIDKIRDDCAEDDESQQALGAEWAGLAVATHFGIEE